jgi:hypothetical protein
MFIPGFDSSVTKPNKEALPILTPPPMSPSMN